MGTEKSSSRGGGNGGDRRVPSDPYVAMATLDPVVLDLGIGAMWDGLSGWAQRFSRGNITLELEGQGMSSTIQRLNPTSKPFLKLCFTVIFCH